MTDLKPVLFTGTPSAAVLRNQGVPVRVYVLDQSGERKLDLTDPDEPRPEFERRFVRFTTAVLADLEEEFGGLGVWNDLLAESSQQAALTMTKTLALMWDVSRHAAGTMMIDGQFDSYATAIGGAYLLASGGEVEQVGKLLTSGLMLSQTKRRVATLVTDEALDAESKTTEEASKQIEAAIDELAAERAAQAAGKAPKKKAAKKTATRPLPTEDQDGSSSGRSGSSSGVEQDEALASSGS